MNDPQKNYNALLLEVMAHDLMAPLTAIKWQIELLAKSYKDTEKREKYLKGLTESTELGIKLGKYAHITGKILGGAYEGYSARAKLSTVVKEAVSDLFLQYERHALLLKMEDLEQNDSERDFDVQLVQLYVWCIAKYFLAATVPKSEVLMKGVVQEREGKKIYIFSASSQNVDKPEVCTKTFEEGSDHELAQLSVFSKLIHISGGMLHCVVHAEVEERVFKIVTEFEI